MAFKNQNNLFLNYLHLFEIERESEKDKLSVQHCTHALCQAGGGGLYACWGFKRSLSYKVSTIYEYR